MLDQYHCLDRRRAMWRNLEAELDFIVITDPRHIFYFTGDTISSHHFGGFMASQCLMLSPSGEAVILMDNIQPNQAHSTPGVKFDWYRGIGTPGSRNMKFHEALGQWLKTKVGVSCRLGYDPHTFPSALKEKLEELNIEWIDITPVVNRLRLTKWPDEIELIKRSIIVAESVMETLRRKVKPGISELDIFSIAQARAIAVSQTQCHLYGDFFVTNKPKIVNSLPTHYQVAKGDLFLADFSVVLGFLRGDIATTFVVGSQPTDEQWHWHETISKALSQAEQELRPGRKASEIYACLASCLGSMRELFKSHAGHGLGLEHPEPPFITPKSSDILRENQIITLEPSLRQEGRGIIRYENNYIITKSGFERLSQHSLSIKQ